MLLKQILSRELIGIWQIRKDRKAKAPRQLSLGAFSFLPAIYVMFYIKINQVFVYSVI